MIGDCGRAATTRPADGAILSTPWVAGCLATGDVVSTLPAWVEGCMPPPGQTGQPAVGQDCFAKLADLGYRQLVTYQPDSRYWAFQWSETTIFLALTLLLAGFCFWWIRRRLS